MGLRDAIATPGGKASYTRRLFATIADRYDLGGLPTTAFNICTFWYIDALARIGRREEAREMFGEMLASRNHVGLLSEDIAPGNGEHWGNYPQTYSLVGIVNAAMRLSRGWEAFT